MKRTLLIVLASLVVLGALTACSTTPVTVTSSPNVPTVSASGHGEVYLAPDLAYINIGVHTEDPSVSAALTANSNQAKAVADALVALGVETKDIQTSNFSVYPMSTYGPDGNVSGKYYAVDNTVYVTVRDLTKLGTLLDSVVSSGANSINSISFDVENKDAALAQARDMAIANAKSEAEGIAKAADIQLGSLQNISISNSSSGTIYDGKGGNMAAAYSSVPVSAGQLLISVDAYLTYAIK